MGVVPHDEGRQGHLPTLDLYLCVAFKFN
jgi:hypothetical protein